MAALGLVAILAGARVALAQVDTIAGAPGCWFVIDMSKYQNCHSFCAGIGGTCDKDAMIHTGSPVGQHFWPDATLKPNWAIVECYSSDGDLWGANGLDWSGASDTCGFSTYVPCSFPCACTVDECVAPTAPPTDAPTEAPTEAPTPAEPTEEPTVTIGSEIRTAPDEAMQRSQDGGLALPSYRPLFQVTIGSEIRTASDDTMQRIHVTIGSEIRTARDDAMQRIQVQNMAAAGAEAAGAEARAALLPFGLLLLLFASAAMSAQG